MNQIYTDDISRLKRFIADQSFDTDPIQDT